MFATGPLPTSFVCQPADARSRPAAEPLVVVAGAHDRAARVRGSSSARSCSRRRACTPCRPCHRRPYPRPTACRAPAAAHPWPRRQGRGGDENSNNLRDGGRSLHDSSWAVSISQVPWLARKSERSTSRERAAVPPPQVVDGVDELDVDPLGRDAERLLDQAADRRRELSPSPRPSSCRCSSRRRRPSARPSLRTSSRALAGGWS